MISEPAGQEPFFFFFNPSAISLLEVVKGNRKGRLGSVLAGRGGCCAEPVVQHGASLCVPAYTPVAGPSELGMSVGLVKGFMLWIGRQDSLPLLSCPLSLLWDEHLGLLLAVAVLAWEGWLQRRFSEKQTHISTLAFVS